MTAFERSSLNGPSMTTTSLANSTTTLWCVPPIRYQTPSPSFVVSTLTGGLCAFVTLAGTSSGTGAFDFTSATVTSRTRNPPCVWTIAVGNVTVPKRR